MELIALQTEESYGGDRGVFAYVRQKSEKVDKPTILTAVLVAASIESNRKVEEIAPDYADAVVEERPNALSKATGLRRFFIIDWNY